MDYTPPEYTEIVNSLETKYAKENLKFTIPFRGSYPVQAFGELKGMRFYFRFRSDTASLHIGVYNQTVENEDYEKQELFKKERRVKTEEAFAAGQMTQQDYQFSILIDERETVKNLPNAEDYYPNPKLVTLSVHNYSGDSLAGDLKPEEAEDIFSQLVEQLLEKSK
jgi:hypothetical protein